MDSTAVVRDSAGVTIVENRGPAWAEGEAWRVAETPSVDIGMLEGPTEYQLFRVTDALRLTDGRIVVANAGTGELRYYDAAGAHLLSAGRQGGGPGEFERLAWIETIAPDSVLAYDSRLDRISTFDPAGRFVRGRTFQSTPQTGSLEVIGRFRDGSYLLQVPVGTDEPIESGLRRIPFILFRSSGAGAPFDSLGSFPGREWYQWIRTSEGSITGVRILYPPYVHRLALALYGERFYVGPQYTYEIGVYDAAAGLERRIRWSGPDLTLTPELIESYAQDRLAAAETEERRRSIEQTLAGMEFPERVPAYGEILVDASGNLWVERFRRPGEEANRWEVFDPEGQLLGTVDLPVGLEVFQIGSDFVLGRWQDELEVEYVRQYELIKPTSFAAEERP